MSTTTPTTTPPAGGTLPPLDDVMLAMDVVDTLRHRQDLVERELDATSREAQLVGKLREIYLEQGIEVPERILAEGVEALDESRFTYTPPRNSLSVRLARLYVARHRWGPWVIGLLAALILAVGSYQFIYLPMQRAQAVAEAVALKQDMPEEMDRLYNTIYEETKVQSAALRAGDLRARGKAAANAGDRAEAQAAIADLEALRDRLRADYVLRVVNQPGVKSGFWTFPEANTDATNYYIVVQAIDSNGHALDMPIENEETGVTETVSMWGIRVPEAVYRTVEEDKRDNGIIDHNIVGRKLYGFYDVDYTVPIVGGAVTRW